MFPALVLFHERTFPPVKKAGAVDARRTAGIAAGNARLPPQGAGGLQDAVISAAIPLALPPVFFPPDLERRLNACSRALPSFDLEVVFVAALSASGTAARMALFRTGGDTMIVTSVAGIRSPPFAPVAGAAP